MHEHEPLVAEYSHERHRPREAEALKTLQKIASVVKPIMRQRNWRVGTLKEFFPAERNLLGLNINKGQSICIRLRYASDEKQFLPFEDVVDTMLHELCHIVHGPHNEAFHKLWDQLRDEHESLLRKGYTGEGFLGKGYMLGGRRIPMDEARRKARAAAEKRQTLTAGSGQRLGGAPISRNQDIRNVIANAVERRKNITRGCASDSAERESIIAETTKNGFRTKAEEDDANERAIAQAYMELVQQEQREKYGKDYIEPSQQFPSGSQGRNEGPLNGSGHPPPPVPSHSKPGPSRPAHAVGTRPPAHSQSRPVDDSWTCTVCTLHNPATFLCCDACGTERSSAPISNSDDTFGIEGNWTDGGSKPNPPRSSLAEESKLQSSRSKRAREKYAEWTETGNKKPIGWLCHNCGTFMEREFWSCSSCGKIKTSS